MEPLEFILELFLCVVDYTILLFFFLKLIDEKWRWKQAIVMILCTSLFQLGKEQLFELDAIGIILDKFIVIAFLLFYSKRLRIFHILSATMINNIFSLTMLFYISIAINLGVDIAATTTFGLERIIFSLIMKLYIILALFVATKPLIQLHVILDEKTSNILIFISSIIFLFFTEVYNDSENRGDLMIVFFICLILISVQYLLYQYCILLKKQADDKFVMYAENITSDYVLKLEKEHNEIKKIRHDIHNQLDALESLIAQGKYGETKDVLRSLSTGLEDQRVSITGNVYLDAILRQKMKLYSDIDFKVNISLAEDFSMDGKDLISLVSNIIDNACEELYRTQMRSFVFTMEGDHSKLLIKQSNCCRKNHSFQTQKDQNYHGYGLKIIKDIVNKYHGNMDCQIENDIFMLDIFMILNKE